MKNYKQNLNFYYIVCNEVAKIFSDQYFCDKNITFDDIDEWWVADSPGTVLCINDYFWDMEDMVEALKVGVKKKTLFEYYDWSLDENGEENKSLHYFLNLRKLKLCKPKIPVEGVLNKNHSTVSEDKKWNKLKKNGWPNLVKLLKPKNDSGCKCDDCQKVNHSEL